jgi:hypothetical protein
MSSQGEISHNRIVGWITPLSPPEVKKSISTSTSPIQGQDAVSTIQPLESAIAQKLEEEELTISDLLIQSDITLKVNR